MGGGKSGSSTTVVNVPGPTAEETALQKKQLELAEFQLVELRKQSEFQEEEREKLAPFIEELQAQAKQEKADADRYRPIVDEIMQQQLETIRRGGAASPEELKLIGEATDEAIKAGRTDIDRFVAETSQRLREELAPSLGLRPTDAPVLDRASQIGAEATRQFGQLTSGLRSSQAQAKLSFPLARDAATSAIAQFQQDFARAKGEFSNQLQEAAFLNRLRLSGQSGSLGLGLATGVNPGIPTTIAALSGARVAGAPRTTNSSLSGGLGLTEGASILGGVGGLLQGVGAVKSLFSSAAFKDVIAHPDPEAVLARLMELPLVRFTYKGAQREHIGTFAEDFQKAFGLGNGVTIDFVDAFGVLLAAVQGLAKRMEAANG